jgi:hypothetical protein
MYWRVVPGLGGRDARHPEELLEGTDKNVVAVGEVVVGVAAAAEPDSSGMHEPTATATVLTNARAESAGSRSRTGRARLS